MRKNTLYISHVAQKYLQPSGVGSSHTEVCFDSLLLLNGLRLGSALCDPQCGWMQCDPLCGEMRSGWITLVSPPDATPC